MATGACQVIDDIPNGNAATWRGIIWHNAMLSGTLITKSVVKTVAIKQRLLFYGYMRMYVVSQIIDKSKIIPLDIIDLCRIFFEIDIESEKALIDDNLYELHQFSIKCYKQREYWISYEILKPLSTFESNNPSYHNTLGLVLHHWNVLDEAEKEYKISLELKEESHIYRWNYALLLEAKNKYNAAVNLYVEASNLDPNEPEYFHKAACCYDVINDDQNAKIYYLKAIKLNDKKSLYFYNFAKYLCKMGEFDKAEEYFEKAMTLKPDSWRQIYEFAKTLRSNNEFERAEIYYKKCLALNDQIGFVVASYAHLFYLRGDYNEAKKYLNIAKDLPRLNLAWYNYYCGLVECGLNNKHESDKFLAESIKYFDLMDVDTILLHLGTFKKQDPKNIGYALKCEYLLAKALHDKL